MTHYENNDNPVNSYNQLFLNSLESEEIKNIHPQIWNCQIPNYGENFQHEKLILMKIIENLKKELEEERRKNHENDCLRMIFLENNCLNGVSGSSSKGSFHLETSTVVPDWDTLLAKEPDLDSKEQTPNSECKINYPTLAENSLKEILNQIDNRFRKKGSYSISLLKRACVLLPKFLTKPEDLNGNFHIWKHRPIGYPLNVPYGDPNNKDKRTEYRMSKDDLKNMYEFYREKYDTCTYLSYDR